MKSLGDEVEDESFDSFKLEDSKSEKDDQVALKEVKNLAPQSFFLEILGKRLGIENYSNASDILADKIWPLSKKSCENSISGSSRRGANQE